MSRTRNNESTVARRIGALKRVIDTSLMELTEVEVLINARGRWQVEGGELERTRMVLTDGILKMEAELKQLQRSVGRVGRALAASEDAHTLYRG
jgi:hypothetical protein